ncbi:MAG: translocation/assembly module TamB domain-containing protein, partial [Planctomycetota bacterium]
MRDLYVEADLTTEAADGAPAGALEVVGTGVDPFDPIWIELLEGEPEASADLAALQELDPTGLVDVALVQPFTQEFLPLGPPSVLVGLRRNSLRRDHVEVAELRGEIATDLSTASIPELSGTVAGTPVTLQAVRLLPEERLDDLDRPSRALLDRTLPSALTEYVVTARVDLESARVDSDLVARVTDSESSGDWQILLDADDALLLVALPRSGEPALGVSGLFRPHDLRFTNNFRLSSAELDLQHLIVDGASVRGIGRVDKAFGDASGLVIDNAGATISYVEGRLTLDGLDAGLAGGRIQGQQIRVDGRSTGARAASFELMPPYRFDLALQFSGIDVNAVLSEVLSSNSADAGLLRGNLQLIGQPDDPLGLEGTGFLALDDARLYSIPVVRALFKQLGFDASATFDWMRTSIEIRDGELRMTDAVARSPLLRLVGGGTLGLDGRLEHDFDLTYSLVDKLFVLNQLIYWLQSNLLRIAVRGDMTRPRVILTNPVLDLFGRSRQMPPRLPFPR